MLEIRSEELDALAHLRLGQFVDRLEAHFREHFPERDTPDMRAQLHEQLTAAGKLGLVTQADLFRYMSLPGLLGFDFAANQTHEWIARGLRDPAVPQPSERLARVLARLKKEMKRAAAASAARAAFEQA